MPSYEYECEQGHRHERVNVKANDRKPVRCPECHGLAVRVWSVPARPIVKGGTPNHHG
jgi:putative FmdB family regulatory protein